MSPPVASNYSHIWAKHHGRTTRHDSHRKPGAIHHEICSTHRLRQPGASKGSEKYWVS